MALAILKKKYGGIFLPREDGRPKLFARLQRFGDFVANPGRHWRVHKAASSGSIKFIENTQPRIKFKYLHPRYLVRGLSTSCRAKIFIHHYDFLKENLADDFLISILTSGVNLWDYDGENGHHCIKLIFSHPTDNEGELTLEYLFNSTLIYLMSFSFAPGSLAGRNEKTLILLTRIQGAANEFEAVRSAMKDVKGLSAASLLMAALQGVAVGTEARTILSVCADAQVCLSDSKRSVFLNAYDKYLSELGAERYSEKFFILAVPLAERPLEEVKSSNRSRVRFQRERKHDLREAVTELFLRSRI